MNWICTHSRGAEMVQLGPKCALLLTVPGSQQPSTTGTSRKARSQSGTSAARTAISCD